MVNAWWRAFESWPTQNASLLEVPASAGESVCDVATRLRRALRDLRDREARREAAWRQVAFLGVVQGDGSALLVVEHADVSTSELGLSVRRRWPGAEIVQPRSRAPTVELDVDAAVALARRQRGLEPLRVVVMPQRRPVLGITAPWIEPLPVLI